MQNLTDSHKKIQVDGANIRQVINNLDTKYPGIKGRLVDGDRIKLEISVAIDGEISTLGMINKVSSDSEIHFLPAIAGG
jgi:molybdopterin synthase sulfur carrier subunit|tara:strand:+ start:336 stop:572 length:237 start_codon:yes stop_codon:yes gene_type:complete